MTQSTVSRIERTRNTSPRRKRMTRDEVTVETLLTYGNCVQDSTGCVKWLAGRTASGYGVINLRGEKTQYAHRLIYQLLTGESPECVMHSCDNPMCVRSDHLIGGTLNDNNQDMKRKGRYHDQRRATWDETWIAVASDIAKRSRCVRRAAGCVLVTPSNRVISTGFNGPPAQLIVDDSMCTAFCPRVTAKTHSLSYDNCVSAHAEGNALMHSDRDKREGGAAYITTAPCFDCAKLLSNSGIAVVKTRVLPQDWYRNPKRNLEFIMSCGVQVEVLL